VSSPIPILLIVVPLTGAVISALASEASARAPRVVALVALTVTAVLAVAGLGLALGEDGPLRHEVGGWPPPFGIELMLDPLSGFIAAVVAVTGLVVVAYPTGAGFGIEPRRRLPLYALVLLLLTGLLGVTMTADLFNLFIFLEIYSIASYALVALGGPRATFASLRYLLFGTTGSGLYLLGVGFLYFMTGSLNMGDVSEQLGPIGTSPTVVAALVLILAGLGLKMALFPLHVWLPEAHSYAPPAVAALLAAVQVKVAAYALIRILYDVFGVTFVRLEVPVADLLVAFGVVGIVFGSAMAIAQTDLKRLLAYSTVAQLSFIGVGIGIATPLALAAALLHVLNHALMKACLFLVAGGIYERTGIKEIPRLAGIGRRMPLLATALTVAALSMVGVPPTGGFFSKWYLLLASLEEGRPAVAAVIVASSLLTLWYVLRLLESVWSDRGDVDEAVATSSEPRAAVTLPVAVLSVGIVVAGLANVAIMGNVLDAATTPLLATAP
jgi:multicomponent Na+:H+ antiporter subunit D